MLALGLSGSLGHSDAGSNLMLMKNAGLGKSAPNLSASMVSTLSSI